VFSPFAYNAEIRPYNRFAPCGRVSTRPKRPNALWRVLAPYGKRVTPAPPPYLWFCREVVAKVMGAYFRACGIATAVIHHHGRIVEALAKHFFTPCGALRSQLAPTAIGTYGFRLVIHGIAFLSFSCVRQIGAISDFLFGWVIRRKSNKCNFPYMGV